MKLFKRAANICSWSSSSLFYTKDTLTLRNHLPATRFLRPSCKYQELGPRFEKWHLILGFEGTKCSGLTVGDVSEFLSSRFVESALDRPRGSQNGVNNSLSKLKNVAFVPIRICFLHLFLRVALKNGPISNIGAWESSRTVLVSRERRINKYHSLTKEIRTFAQFPECNHVERENSWGDGWRKVACAKLRADSCCVGDVVSPRVFCPYSVVYQPLSSCYVMPQG